MRLGFSPRLADWETAACKRGLLTSSPHPARTNPRPTILFSWGAPQILPIDNARNRLRTCSGAFKLAASQDGRHSSARACTKLGFDANAGHSVQRSESAPPHPRGGRASATSRSRRQSAPPPTRQTPKLRQNPNGFCAMLSRRRWGQRASTLPTRSAPADRPAPAVPRPAPRAPLRPPSTLLPPGPRESWPAPRTTSCHAYASHSVIQV